MELAIPIVALGIAIAMAVIAISQKNHLLRIRETRFQTQTFPSQIIPSCDRTPVLTSTHIRHQTR